MNLGKPSQCLHFWVLTSCAAVRYRYPSKDFLLMKTFGLIALAVIALNHTNAFADEYGCSPADGTCHEYEVTAEDLGQVDESLCGPSSKKDETDGCHLISFCGVDLGKGCSSRQQKHQN
jgi:hypothetical protein